MTIIARLLMFPALLAATAQESKEYTRYASYHPYCSTPSQMKQRAIPPLSSQTLTNISRTALQLIHVTALIRHGARTPNASPHKYICWDGYWTDPATGIWNCELKSYDAAPPYSADLMFEKQYDALIRPSGERTGNELNGDCMLGQLLMRGYEQELVNGYLCAAVCYVLLLHLRQAYLYDGNNTSQNHGSSNPSMRLWDMATSTIQGSGKFTKNSVGDASKKIYQEPNLRYRADDNERTLMSGQILLRALFGPEIQSAENNGETTIIKLHTADYKKDHFFISKETCPRLADLEAAAYKSEEFRRWNETSVEVQIIRKFFKSKMGYNVIRPSILDCLMTTMCTDRPLPELLDDYDGSLGPTPMNVEKDSEGITIVSEKDFTNIFERLVNYVVKHETFPYRYNDAALAKLGMGPLWKEIMTNIMPIVGATSNYTTFVPRTPPKLALFSGHDTTLMPILATLGQDVWAGTEWAPYASMILIEIYEVGNPSKSEFTSGYAFRLIYNGEVLTSRMDGCSSDLELCDSEVLLDRVLPFAISEERDCAAASTDQKTSITDGKTLSPDEETYDDVEEEEIIPEPIVADTEVNPRQKWGMFGSVILSAAISSIATCFLMRQHYSNAYRQASTSDRDLSIGRTYI
ncbi:hypothetical protein ACHAXN_001730 [Cyclotella atomus]